MEIILKIIKIVISIILLLPLYLIIAGSSNKKRYGENNEDIWLFQKNTQS